MLTTGRRPGPTGGDADPRVPPPSITVYLRSNSPHCLLLCRSLRRQGLAFVEVDLWRDPAAAARVREVAGGRETVPTVQVGGRWLVDARAEQVRALAMRR